MAQTKSLRTRISSSSKGYSGGGPPAHLLLMELKHRILAALSKLSDRDTHQLAVDDLEKIVEFLSPEGIAMCLSCIYDTDTQQKSIVKKECIKMFGTLASIHGSLLVPHLPKIVSTIVRRLKDPDTSVRDACVDTMGVLSANVFSLGMVNRGARQQGSTGTTGVAVQPHAMELTAFVKPLFDALTEQNKSVQNGAAMCLARVILCTKNHHQNPNSGSMGRLCQRVCKLLGNPTFLAKAALLPVISSLSQVGAVNQQMLAPLVSCVHEALESSDWSTRKAAGETLIRMASSLGPALTNFKSQTLLILESCRFDKVKPVRDLVQDAIQIWRTLPGHEKDILSTQQKPEASGKGQLDLLDIESSSPSPLSDRSSSSAKALVVSNRDTNSAAEKLPGILKKRGATGLAEKKPNPDFFNKLDIQAQAGCDDWHIEVAVPRSCPPSFIDIKTEEAGSADIKGLDEMKLLTAAENLHEKTENVLDYTSLQEDNEAYNPYCPNKEDLLNEFEGFVDNNVKSQDGDFAWNADKNVQEDREGMNRSLFLQASHFQANGSLTNHWNLTDPTQDISMNGARGSDGQSTINWLLIQRQISQLEFQQANLLDLLQEFMGSSKSSMLALQTRIEMLERVMEDAAQDLEMRSDFMTNGYGRKNDQNMIHSKYLLPASDHYIMHSSIRENMSMMNGYPSVVPRTPPKRKVRTRDAHHMMSWSPSATMVPQEMPWPNGPLYELPLRAGSPSRMHLIDAYPESDENHNELFLQTREEDNKEEQKMVFTRRVWDRDTGLPKLRLGEGPSARSVWQAAKDEATLAAIRGAGENGTVHAETDQNTISDHEQTSTQQSGSMQEAPPAPDTNTSLGRNEDQSEKRAYLRLWSRAVDYVRTGNMDLAYKEMLDCGDELMLMRLMNKTGPVLSQLSATTANEMLHTVALVLAQQSFFDFTLPWIQQVVDLIVDMGPEGLDLSPDVRRDLLQSVQDARNRDVPEGWSGNSVEELCSILGQAWPNLD